VLVLGGRVPEYLRHNTHVLRLVGEFTQRNKWLFAICHGIPVFNAAGVVAGRKGTVQTWESHPEFYREVMACLAS
jgi:protease I